MCEKLKTLITEYCASVSLQYSYTLNGDWRKGNKEVKKYVSLYDEITTYGEEAEELLLPLLNSDHPEIAVSIAVELFDKYPEQCISTLQRHENNPGFIGSSAHYALLRLLGNDKAENEHIPVTNRIAYLKDKFTSKLSDPEKEQILEELIKNPPFEAAFEDMAQPSVSELRLSIMDMIVPGIWGILDGGVQWVPDEVPPSKLELLTWLWVIRPDLGQEIASRAPKELREEIHLYDEDLEEELERVVAAAKELEQMRK